MIKNAIQEPGMKKFYSPTFGFLHACKKDGKIWYNLTDVCQCLKIKLKEAETWMKDTKCSVREFNVKRAKITSCNRYVDNDGLSSILIYCCRNSANDYRRWITNTVLYSFTNPEMSFEIKELDDATIATLTAPQITDHYKAMATRKDRAPLIEKAIADARAKAKAEAEAKAATATTQTPQVAPKSSVPTSTPPTTANAPKTPVIAPKPFVPKNGHLLIEDWFRQEFPIVEFLTYMDGVIDDVKKLIKNTPKKDRWAIQHRVNVMTVFRKMLQANEGNVRYSPTPERAATLKMAVN